MQVLNISERDAKYYEKRFERRYKTKCECNVIINQSVFEAEISDISFNGLALLIRDYSGVTDIDDEVEIKILKHNYPAVSMMAEIRDYMVVDDISRLGFQIKSGNRSIWDALVRQAQNGL